MHASMNTSSEFFMKVVHPQELDLPPEQHKESKQLDSHHTFTLQENDRGFKALAPLDKVGSGPISTPFLAFSAFIGVSCLFSTFLQMHTCTKQTPYAHASVQMPFFLDATQSLHIQVGLCPQQR